MRVAALACVLAVLFPAIAAATTKIDVRLVSRLDDAVEATTGSVVLNGGSVDLGNGAGKSAAGIRWRGLAIPAGSTITSAYVVFTSADARSGSASLEVRAQADDSPPTFSAMPVDISSRPLTSAVASWSPAPWAAGSTQHTCDLRAVIQEVVSRPGWTSGNALALVVSGAGLRRAWSYDASPSGSALIHVEYESAGGVRSTLTTATGTRSPIMKIDAGQSLADLADSLAYSQATDAPPQAALTAAQVASPALTVLADASASTDTDAFPIATYHFDFGDGSPVVDVSAPASTTTHTYAAPGNYTITLTVSDTDYLTSDPAQSTVTVMPPDAPPVGGLTVAQAVSPALTVRADASTSTDTDAFPIATYHFDFGDGSPMVDVSAPVDTASHTYAAAGNYTVTLTVTDTGGLLSAPVTAPISVDGAPVAQLAVTQAAAPALTVSADASASTDPDAFPIATYHFNFGDGSPVVDVSAPVDTVSHTYAAAGSYPVTLTVTDTANLTSTPVTSPVSVDGAPVAHVAVTQSAAPALTVRADASASTDPDAFPIVTYHFNFGDGSPVVDLSAPADTVSHTYAVSGDYTVTLTATDTDNLTSAPVTAPITVNPAPILVILERRVATSADDAEEFADSTCHLTSSDLELVHDSSDQTVGMRWINLTIPPGASITAAWIQFSAKESQSVATSLTLRAQAADDAPTFTTAFANVSSRPRTLASTSWAPVPWNAGEVGPNQRTPDLSGSIQEVVNREGWLNGHALVMIVNGTGHRTAWAYDGNAAAAPLLHVEFLMIPPPERPPVARLSVNQLAAPPLTVRADASASSDIDSTPIATYQFDFGDGTPKVTTTAPTAIAQHTYADTGTYVVTLTATDTGNSSSAPLSDTVAVAPSPPTKIAVFVGYYDTHHATNPKPKPDPWMSSSGVVWVGVADDSKGNFDSSCLRVDNLTAGPLNSVVVTADLGSHHYALWGTNSIPVGYRLILAQTAPQNFDGSDTNPAGCYGCDPSLCLTERSNTIPVVHVSIGGPTADYLDVDQVLNTGGYDGGGCPYLGGPLPQTRYDESHPWEQVYSNTPLMVSAPMSGTTSTSAATDAALLPKVLSLSAPSPNPSHGDLAVHFALPVGSEAWIGIYDLSGRLVQTCIDGELRAGDYTLHPDMSGVRPGVYFLRLWTPRGTLRQRFALMR
jgi:PKD repeat protein